MAIVQTKIGNVRGLTGPQGAQGPQGIPGADLTAQTLFSESVANGFTGTYDDWLTEYLGAAVSPELPWCSGEIADRSIAANTLSRLAYVVKDGDGTMISGDGFVAPEPGKYYLSVRGGHFPMNPQASCLVFRNYSGTTAPNPETPYDVGRFGANITYYLPTVSVMVWLDKLDYLTVWLQVSSAVATIHQYGAIPQFFFGKIS